MKLRFSKIKTDEPQFEVFDGTRNITITKDLYESLQLPDGALHLDPATDLKSIKINGTNTGITISPELLQKNETEKSNIVKLVLNDHSDIDNVIFDPNKKYEIVLNFDPYGVETDGGKLVYQVIEEELTKGTNIYKLTFGRDIIPISFYYPYEGKSLKESSVRVFQINANNSVISDPGIAVNPQVSWLDNLICEAPLETAKRIYEDSQRSDYNELGINSDVAIYANDGVDLPIALPEMTKDELLNYSYISGKRYMFILTPELLEPLPTLNEFGESAGIVFDDVLDQIRTTKDVKIGRITIKDGVTTIHKARVFRSPSMLVYQSIYIPSSVVHVDDYSFNRVRITYKGNLSEFMSLLANIGGNHNCVVRDTFGNFDWTSGEPM